MQVDVMNLAGETVDRIELPAAIFEAPINVGLMHQALQRQLANARLGTHDTQTRAEVSRSGAKAWRQKGTGRARQGSRRAPQWRGGGVVFGPHPRSYAQAMPKRMRRAALRSALSARAADAALVVVDELRLDEPRTRVMAEALRRLVGRHSVLVLLAERDEPIERALRNLPEAKYLRASYLNVRDLLGHERVLVPLSALRAIEALLGQGAAATPVAAETAAGGAEAGEELAAVAAGEPPATRRPAAKRAATKRPAAKRAAVKQPAEKRPAAKKPAAKKPAAKRPAAKRPAAKRPARGDERA